MRSFARALALALVVLAPTVQAQTSQPKRLYDDALVRERILRQDLQRARTDEAQLSVLTRIRALAGAYEDMSRLFPSSGYADNALWQGAVLTADAFWEFGEAADRALALRLFSSLTSRFPASSLTTKVSSHAKRLQDAKPTTTASPVRTPAPATPPAPAPVPPAPPRVVAASPTSPPATGLAALPAALTGVSREVLPEVLRIVIQLGKEVTFYDERIDGPPRVFLDLHNTRAIEPLKDAVIPFPDDVVKQVRIGRQPNSRTRVVLDLKGGDARYSMYTLYDPYRIVVDFERKRTGAPTNNKIAPTSVSSIAPTSEGTIASTSASPITPTSVSTIAPTPDKIAEPLPLDTTPPPPLPPSANVNGGFSLSRQLGLGATRIVIDAGHGGHDPGAKARGLEEAALVLDVALRLEALLKAAGVEVLMTRRTDTFIPLEERTAIANRAGADLFLSIHSNASATDAAHGVETYFLNFAPNPQAEAIAARENAGGSKTMRNLPDIVRAIALNNKIDESRDFASMVQNALYTKLQKSNRYVRNLGVKQAPFMVLVGATMPSILAEISFITNRQEATLLKTDKYKQTIAEALLAGVLRYQQALKKVPAIAAQRP
jgi:N-acetylmuramoyl-L-alanine amidase